MSDNGMYGKGKLIDDVTAATQGLTRKQVEQVVNATIEAIGNRLRSGQTVTLTGFGTFSVKQRNARQGVNPQTKEKIQIAAGQRAHWKPSSTLLGGTKKGENGNYAKERGGR